MHAASQLIIPAFASPAVHDPLDTEYSILKQRLARRLEFEGHTDATLDSLDLVELTKVGGGFGGVGVRERGGRLDGNSPLFGPGQLVNLDLGWVWYTVPASADVPPNAVDMAVACLAVHAVVLSYGVPPFLLGPAGG